MPKTCSFFNFTSFRKILFKRFAITFIDTLLPINVEKAEG